MLTWAKPYVNIRAPSVNTPCAVLTKNVSVNNCHIVLTSCTLYVNEISAVVNIHMSEMLMLTNAKKMDQNVNIQYYQIAIMATLRSTIR
jgi:hypothetical protein